MSFIIEIQRDNGTWENKGSFTSSPVTLTGLAAGSYRARVNNVVSGSAVNVAASNIQKPTAVITATPQSGVAPLTVAFSAASSADPNSGGSILGYEWNFGDGTTSVANAPSKTYNTAGTYTVTLRVMNSQNVYSDPVTRTITVTGSGSGTTITTFDATGWGIGNQATFNSGDIILSGSNLNGSGYAYYKTPFPLTTTTNFSAKVHINKTLPAGILADNEGFTVGLFNVPDPTAITVPGASNSCGFDGVSPQIRVNVNNNNNRIEGKFANPDWQNFAQIDNYTEFENYAGDIYIWFDLVNGNALNLFLAKTNVKPATPSWSVANLTTVISTKQNPPGNGNTLAAHLGSQFYLVVASRSDFAEGVPVYRLQEVTIN